MSSSESNASSNGGYYPSASSFEELNQGTQNSAISISKCAEAVVLFTRKNFTELREIGSLKGIANYLHEVAADINVA